MKQSNLPPFQIVTHLRDPLALFFRPGRADHTTLSQLISENRIGFSGVVFDPCHLSFQKELRNDLWARDLYTVLDSLGMELATLGGLTPARANLPWANSKPHSPSVFDGKKVDATARLITECAIANAFNAVVAPCHYLRRGANDPWLLIDRRLTSQLRRELNDAGHKDIAIYYPLALPTSIFFDRNQRSGLKASLANLDIDGIWLRIHPFGSQGGDMVLRKYISACQDFHAISIPLVAEKTGSIGLPLLAFGAVAGLESGITSGEQFNFGRLKTAPKKKPVFSARPRVYLPSLGIFLQRSEAAEFFKNPELRRYACRDTDCCHRGVDSMLKDPRRHFTFTRMEEVGLLSSTPEKLRPDSYLQRLLHPADDHLRRVLASGLIPSSFIPRLEKRLRRLHGWRKTLTEMTRSGLPQTFSPALSRYVANIRVTA